MKINKNLKYFVSLLLSSAVLLSCESTKIQLTDYNPLLMKTSYSNRGLSWYVEEVAAPSYKTQPEDDGVVTGLINRAFDKDNPEFTGMQERINTATEIFIKSLRENGITVYDPETKSDAVVYTKYRPEFFDSISNVVPAKGYKAIGSVNGRNDVIDAKDTGAKSLCYLSFKFQRAVAKTGYHEDGVSARVLMKVFISDENGKKLLYKEYTAQSSDFAPYDSWGNWNKEYVCKMIPDLVQIVSNKFVMDYIYGDFDEINSKNASKKVDVSKNIDIKNDEISAENNEIQSSESENTDNSDEDVVVFKRKPKNTEE